MNETESIVFSAPAKIHLLGEHFVVLGGAALLAAVDRRCSVTLTPHSPYSVNITSEGIDSKVNLPIAAVLEKRASAQNTWNEYTDSGDIELLKSITKEPLDYAVLAAAEALHYYGNEVIPSGFKLSVKSDVPIGAGLGSSASLAVAIAGAVTLFLGKPFNPKTINNIAYEAEKRRHGNPSGADNATIAFGGVIRFIRDPKTIEPLDLTIPQSLAENFVLIDTGHPNESTGEMVGLVRALFEKDPDMVKACLEDQNRLVDTLISSAVPRADGEEFIKIIRQGEANLDKIGVVSPSSRTIIEEIEKAGGAGKICGAGGKTGPTGILLTYHPDRTVIEEIAKSHNLPYFSVALGAPGVKQEN